MKMGIYSLLAVLFCHQSQHVNNLSKVADIMLTNGRLVTACTCEITSLMLIWTWTKWKPTCRWPHGCFLCVCMSETVVDKHVQVWLCAFCLLAVGTLNNLNEKSPPSQKSFNSVSVMCSLWKCVCMCLFDWRRGVFNGEGKLCQSHIHSPSVQCSVLNQESAFSQVVMHHMWLMSEWPGDLSQSYVQAGLKVTVKHFCSFFHPFYASFVKNMHALFIVLAAHAHAAFPQKRPFLHLLESAFSWISAYVQEQDYLFHLSVINYSSCSLCMWVHLASHWNLCSLFKDGSLLQHTYWMQSKFQCDTLMTEPVNDVSGLVLLYIRARYVFISRTCKICLILGA